MQQQADAPQITPFDVEAEIRSEFYFTAAEGVLGESHMGTKPASHTGLDMVTFCALILRNGTKIIGINHGPVARCKFNVEVGRRYARENAIEQAWLLLSFRRRDALALEPADRHAATGQAQAGRPESD